MTTQLNQRIRKTVGEYADADDESLLEQIGIQVVAIEQQTIGPPSGNELAPYVGGVMGPLDDVRRIGARLLRNANLALYRFTCGKEAEDVEDRNSLLAAAGLGKEELAAIIAGLLVSSFGIAPAIAPFLGVVIARRLLPIVGETLCEEWGRALEGGI